MQKYRAGYAFTRQLTFALTDLRLHSEYVPGGPVSPHDVYLDTYAKVTVSGAAVACVVQRCTVAAPPR